MGAGALDCSSICTARGTPAKQLHYLSERAEEKTRMYRFMRAVTWFLSGIEALVNEIFSNKIFNDITRETLMGRPIIRRVSLTGLMLFLHNYCSDI